MRLTVCRRVERGWGKIRIRTPKGNPALGKNTRGALRPEAIGAYFQDNDALIEWVNHQPLASPITCLGDGHDGVWNIIDEIAPNGERRKFSIGIT